MFILLRRIYSYSILILMKGKLRVLEERPCTFNKRSLIPVQWKPKMRLDLDAIQRLLVRIQLLGLP